MDRLNRKRLMIVVDLINAALIASIPLLATLGLLSIWWIYVASFMASTVSSAFQSAEFTVIPSLVNQDNLVVANGRIQASYSAAAVAGPLLAGVFVTFMPLYVVLLYDALSFVISALSLALIRRSFNAGAAGARTTSIRQDMVEGLRYVLGHPVLRNISLMMALVNFVGSTTSAQLVLFAEQRLHANDAQVGYLYSAGSLGVVLLALAAGPLRARWSFSTVALGALMMKGLLQVIFALTTWYGVALALWALYAGLGVLFNINTGSLRQAIVPNHMLGRVNSIGVVLAWSAIPFGAFLGGLVIEKTDNVQLVYLVIGLFVFLIPLCFWFTPLGHAERYLPQKAEATGASVGQ